jgi:hypothetical protein
VRPRTIPASILGPTQGPVHLDLLGNLLMGLANALNGNGAGGLANVLNKLPGL